MTRRELGLIGFGILLLAIELLLIDPIPWLIGASLLASFGYAAWWLSTLQARFAEKGNRKTAAGETWFDKWFPATVEAPKQNLADHSDSQIVFKRGKFKGVAIEDAPSEYLLELLDTHPEWLERNYQQAIAEEIRFRKRFEGRITF